MNTADTFSTAYGQFLYEIDPQRHRGAIRELLKPAGLANEFMDLIKEKDAVEGFFHMWAHAAELEEDPNDKKGLAHLGRESQRLYDRQDYTDLCDVFYGQIFQNLADFLRLKERSDFEELTDHDLFAKHLLPDEIYIQFFLVGTLAKNKQFEWNRGEAIARQSLACMIVCFGGMYDFFHESDL